MNKFLPFLFLILLSFPAFSQSDSLTPSFDEQKLEEFRNSEDYSYVRPTEKIEQQEQSTENSFARFIGSIFGAIADFVSSTFGLIIMIVVLFSLIYLGFLRSRKKKAKEKDKVEHEEIEDIVEIDDSFKKLNSQLKKAIKAENYRLAIRFHFIILIKQLDEQKLIRYHRQKTNRQYAFELNQKHRANFKTISKVFEYTWYGDYAATLALFEKNKELAKTFKSTGNVA